MDRAIEELFGVALGLAKPWQVVKVTFSPQDRQLDLWLDFAAGSRFACSECGQLCGVKDTRPRHWRHLNFFQHKTYLHARQPRVDCPEHGVRTVEVPWARPGVGFTRLFEAMVLVMAQNGMTPRQVGRVIGEWDTLIWRILQHHVQAARQEADFSEVRAVGVDETSRSRGQNYLSVFVDLEQSRVVYATEGREATTVKAFRQDLETHAGQAEQVHSVCMDMSAAYQAGFRDSFPNAEVTFDPYHLVKLLNDAVDKVRRLEVVSHPELKKTRYVWLKNDWNRTEEQESIFEELRSSKLATVRATHIKSVFQDLFALEDPAEAEPALKQWYFWATHSRIPQIIKAARTIKEHWAGVLRWFYSRLSNGVLEAINGLIQSAKRKARGFRSTEYLITMVYLIASKLDFKLPECFSGAHTK